MTIDALTRVPLKISKSLRNLFLAEETLLA
jgi:hypothetical protein